MIIILSSLLAVTSITHPYFNPIIQFRLITWSVAPAWHCQNYENENNESE